MAILDLSALEHAPLQTDPCDFVVVRHFVRPEALAAINNEYPDILEPGNFPPDQLQYGATFAALLKELASDKVRALFAAKFSVDLSNLLLQTTVRKYSDISDGDIHNDSRTKIVTALIYFNETWLHDRGRLRLLRNPRDISDFAVEVAPEKGTLLAFRRSERSYHGFLPCAGERRSLQMYWVKPKRQDRDARSPGSLRKRIKRWFKNG
jgi:SM-20-related protein